MEHNNSTNRTLKILAIGNSFSVDAMEYLYQIANNAGYEKIVLGNLYIGGASIAEHIKQIEEGLSEYIYYKNTTGEWEERYESNLLYGLEDEEWDMISLQQVSYEAGLFSAYNHQLEQLIEYVNRYKTNPHATLIWHMTWAYQSDSDHGGFIHYHNDQQAMYQAIVDCVKQKIETNDVFQLVIPSGTAIQNLRTSFIGDTLTRDGFHLSFDKGRFCASLMWFQALTKESIHSITYKPLGVTEKEFEMIKEAVNSAMNTPYAVTTITEKRTV